HNRMGITITREQVAAAACRRPKEIRQAVMPIAVFFFDPDRAVLNADPTAGIEAAVKLAPGIETRDDAAIVDCERRRRDLVVLVYELGPPAFRSDVVDHRVGAPQESELGIRLDATKRHGKRCTSA